MKPQQRPPHTRSRARCDKLRHIIHSFCLMHSRDQILRYESVVFHACASCQFHPRNGGTQFNSTVNLIICKIIIDG